MESVAKPIASIKHNLPHPPGFQRVFYRDAIAKFIEKIAPKVSLQKNRVRKIAQVIPCKIGGKKVTKIVYA